MFVGRLRARGHQCVKKATGLLTGRTDYPSPVNILLTFSDEYMSKSLFTDVKAMTVNREWVKIEREAMVYVIPRVSIVSMSVDTSQKILTTKLVEPEPEPPVQPYLH